MRRTVPALVLASALLLAACSQDDGLVTRTESGATTGYVGGRSVTVIQPADRKPAGVVSGTTLDGKEISTSDYAGKVVVVNVWGSWCAPCRKEAPDLSAASKESSKVAQFVGINIRDMDPAPANAFARAFDVSYPSIYDPDGKQLLKLAADLPPTGIPTTLIIDRKGRSAVRIIGVISEGTLTDMISDVADGR